jgi:translation elongation factor EF-4
MTPGRHSSPQSCLNISNPEALPSVIRSGTMACKYTTPAILTPAPYLSIQIISCRKIRGRKAERTMQLAKQQCAEEFLHH